MKALITVHAIIDAVAGVSGLTRTDLVADRRTPEIIEARQVVFWLARELTELSYQTIGGMVGQRDNEAVIAGHRRIAERRKADEPFRMTTDTLLHVLRALEGNKLLSASTVADPLGTARRIVANPAREAMRVPVIEIVAMARLIVELLGQTDLSDQTIMENSDV